MKTEPLPYPSELPMHNRYYTLVPGDIISNGERFYRVTKVFRSPVPGSVPEVSLEQIEKPSVT